MTEYQQKLHRIFNTSLSVLMLISLCFMTNPVLNEIYKLQEDVSGITEQKVTQSEIAQIASDEGYRACYYKDSLGLGTIGFGTLVDGEMSRGDCIDPHKAVKLLRVHYEYHKQSIEKRYPWAEDDVKLVLINLSYNMGETRLSGFKETLKHLKEGEYDLAAGELLDSRYAKQVPNRAGRMAGRIMSLGG